MDSWALDIEFARPGDCAVGAEVLGAVFDDLGALGWQEDADRETGRPVLRVFFPSAVSRPTATRRIRRTSRSLCAEGVLRTVPRTSAAMVEARDWVAEFREGFRGISVGAGLRVVPPWLSKTGPHRPGDIQIVIEPGMAFGTGLHESSRLCLGILQREIGGGERVVDVGAGSGILAIAAVHLGARSAVAIEIDPQAYDNLGENIRLNRVTRRVCVFPGGLAGYLDKRRRGFDVIVCNMLLDRMRPLLGAFAGLARREQPTRVIVSGHLVSERAAVARDLTAAGIAITHRCKLGGWSAFVGRIAGDRRGQGGRGS